MTTNFSRYHNLFFALYYAKIKIFIHSVKAWFVIYFTLIQYIERADIHTSIARNFDWEGPKIENSCDVNMVTFSVTNNNVVTEMTS